MQLVQAIVLVAVDKDDELGLRYVYVFVLFGWCCFGQEQDKWLCLFASVCNPPCSACLPHQAFARCPAPQPLLEWCRHGPCMPTLSVRICRPRLALPNLITAFWVVVATCPCLPSLASTSGTLAGNFSARLEAHRACSGTLATQGSGSQKIQKH